MRWIAAFFLFLAACHRQPLVYSLARQGRTQILTPPPAKPEIKNARKHPAAKTGCDVESSSLSVAWHGNTAKLSMKPEVYYAQPGEPQPGAAAGVSIAESGPRIYVDALAELQRFREALAAKEEAGCLRTEEASHLREAITETFAFPPQIAAYLRFGTYTRAGYLDLVPGFSLRLVSPAGKEPDVSFYRVDGAPGDDRARLTLVSGAGTAMSAPEGAWYFRYLYWTGASAHNFRTTVLGAPDRVALREATAAFLDDPEGYCQKPAPGIVCRMTAPSVGMNPGFYVSVNGRDVFVRVGGSLSEVLSDGMNGLRVAGVRQPLPKNIAVQRSYRGKLIPIKSETAELLGLIAMPGDRIVY